MSVASQKMIANPVPWPNGAKCACCVTFDMDADSLLHLDHPKDAHRRASAISMLQYGPEVATPRIVETYRRLGIRQTFFIPAWCIEQYPQAVDAILSGGHEIGHHGYLHENPQQVTRDEQTYWMDRAIEVIERITGQKPRGWRAPLYNFSDASAGLLIERGFAYDASLMGDDVPYIITASGGELVELPSHWGLDDWPQYVQSIDLDYMMPIRAPDAGFEIFRQEFSAAYAYGGLWVPVLHPFATGRVARWAVVAGFLESVVARGDVWFAPMEDIAAHVRKLANSGDYSPRRVAMPRYSKPIDIRSAPSNKEIVR